MNPNTDALREALIDVDFRAHLALEAGLNDGAVKWRDGLEQIQVAIRNTLAATPSDPLPDEVRLQRAVESMRPLVNEDMDPAMQQAWLEDLARAALTASQSGEGL